MALYTVPPGATINTADVNQIVETMNGTNQIGNPGPLYQFSTQVVTASVASVTFSSIPSGFKHLYISWQARSDTAATTAILYLRINGDSGNNYWSQSSYGLGSTVSAGITGPATGMNAGDMTGAQATSTQMGGGGFMAIPNWGASNNLQGIITCSSAIWGLTSGNMYTEIKSGYYTVTGARTSLTLFPSAGNFAGPVLGGGCIFTMYGSQ